MPREEVQATLMVCVETTFALVAEGPLAAEREALESVVHIVTLL